MHQFVLYSEVPLYMYIHVHVPIQPAELLRWYIQLVLAEKPAPPAPVILYPRYQALPPYQVMCISSIVYDLFAHKEGIRLDVLLLFQTLCFGYVTVFA